jgi:hypothetical protein
MIHIVPAALSLFTCIYGQFYEYIVLFVCCVVYYVQQNACHSDDSIVVFIVAIKQP